MFSKSLKIFILLILIGNLIYADYEIKGDKAYYFENKKYEKKPVIKRILENNETQKFKKISPDIKSFEVLSKNFAKDKNTIYYKEYNIYNIDIKTFEIIDEDTIKDKNTMYIYNEYVVYDENPQKVVNLSDFEVVKNKGKILFLKNDKEIYILSGLQIKKLNGIDIKSFKSLGDGYIEDKNGIYSDNEKLKNVDIKTFKVLGNGYARDKNNLYLGSEIQNFDVDSFKYLGDNYFLDKNGVYSRNGKGNQIITNADIKTFEVLKYGYAKDKNNIYYEYYDTGFYDSIKILDGIDVETFEVIDEYFLKDKNNIYYNNEKLKNINPKNFETIYYGMRNNVLGVVFFKNIDGIYKLDIPNFLDNSENKIEKLNIDNESFEVLNRNYYKDKNNVYCEDKILKNADVKSFEVLELEDREMKESVNNLIAIFEGKENNFGVVTAKDKNNEYYNCKIIKKKSNEKYKK